MVLEKHRGRREAGQTQQTQTSPTPLLRLHVCWFRRLPSQACRLRSLRGYRLGLRSTHRVGPEAPTEALPASRASVHPNRIRKQKSHQMLYF